MKNSPIPLKNQAQTTKSKATKLLSLIHIWQKSSSGKVPGISGEVDVNEFYIDFENAAPNQ